MKYFVMLVVIIALIIINSKLSHKNRTMSRHLQQLYQQGRISYEEYRGATGNMYPPGNWGMNYPYANQPPGYPGPGSNPPPGQWQQPGAPSGGQWRPPAGQWQSPGGPQPGHPASAPVPPEARSTQSAQPAPGQPPQPLQQPQPAPMQRPLTKREAFELEMEAASRRQPSPFAASQPPNAERQHVEPQRAARIPVKVPKPNLRQSFSAVKPANVILILGVLFIAMAGLVFATSQWQFMTNPLRIISVFSLAALFFLVSAVARLRFQLKNTSLAFYVLGSVFLPIGMLAVGYFQLFGWWYSLYGPGRYVLGCVGSLMFLVAMSLGARLYKLPQLVWTALPCGALALAFATMSVRPEAGVLAVVMAIYFCAFSFGCGPLLKRYELSETVIAQLKQYALLQLLAGSMWILYLADSGVLGFGAALLCAIAYLSNSELGVGDTGANSTGTKTTGAKAAGARGALTDAASQESLHIYPFVFFLLASFFFLNDQLNGLVLTFLQGACALVVLENTKLFSGPVRTVLSVAKLAVIGLAVLAGILVRPEWTLSLILALVVLTGGGIFTVLREQTEGQREAWRLTPLLYALPFLIMVTAYGIYDLYLVIQPNGELFLAVVAVAAFLLSRYVPLKEGQMLRSFVSDAIFFMSCFAVYGAVWGSVAGLLAILMGCGIVAICAWDRRPAAYLLPFTVFLTMGAALSVSNMPIPGYAENALIYAFICLMAGATVWFRKHLYAQKLQQPFSLAVSLGAVYYTVVQNSGWWFSASNFSSSFSLLFTAYWLYCLLAEGYPEEAGGLATDEMVQPKPVVSSGIAALAGLHRRPEVICLMIGLGAVSSGWYGAADLLAGWGLAWNAAGSVAVCLMILLLGRLNWVKEDPQRHKLFFWFGLVGLQLSLVLAGGGFHIGGTKYATLFVIVMLLVCAAAYWPLHQRKMTGLAFGPVLVSLYFASYLLTDVSQSVWGFSPVSGMPEMILFALYGGAGRFLYRKVYERGEGLAWQIDWLTIVSAVPVLNMFLIGLEWSAFLFVAGYFLLFYKRAWQQPEIDQMMLTAASVAVGAAVFSQDYKVHPEYRNLLRIFAGLVALLPSHLFIWKQNKRLDQILFGYTAFAIALLMAEAMLYQYPHHALLLGIGSVLLLFFGWAKKRKSWFSLAVVTLVIVAVYLSRHFWLSIGWWVYLLIAGVVLITAGAANEKSKQKGTNLKGRFDELWDDWQW